MPNDEDLRKGFDESKLTNKQAAGILYLIESKIRDRIDSLLCCLVYHNIV